PHLDQVADVLHPPVQLVLGDRPAGLHRHHAVVLDVDAALQQVDAVVEALHRVGVADHDPLRRDTLGGEDVDLGLAGGEAGGVGRDHHSGAGGGPAGGAEGALLAGGDVGQVGGDLADEPGPHPGPGDFVLQVGDQVLGDLVGRVAF